MNVLGLISQLISIETLRLTITLEGMMTSKPVSNQFVLQNMDATTNISQVSKEEMEEK